MGKIRQQMSRNFKEGHAGSVFSSGHYAEILRVAIYW